MSSNRTKYIMDERQVLIVKRSGEREPFSEAKLRHSLKKARASSDMIDNIVGHIESELKDGITTSEIYQHAFSLLKKYRVSVAARYSLKQAIMDLGPEGYLFESFVGELIKSKGFAVEVGKIVEGFCVKHEVDVVGKKTGHHIMVECKLHNSLGIKSDVKVALYVQARFEDIKRKWEDQLDHDTKFHEAWLVTNTKLTLDAIQYAVCVRMKAIGWSYPDEDNLQSLTEKFGLHPLTCLTSLNSSQKRLLLGEGIIFCKDLLGRTDLLSSIGVSQIQIQRMTNEINDLRQSSNFDK
jgi:hypothetical protein